MEEKMLRLFNNEEKRILAESRRRHPKSIGRLFQNKVVYQHEGNFTKCILSNGSTSTIKIGVAKRNPRDRFDPKIGEHVAFAKALVSATIRLSSSRTS